MLRITNTKFNNQEVNAVSARELHAGLELKTQFTDWVKQFLDDFIQGTDFIIDTVTTVDVQTDGHRVTRNLVNYLFSLDMAKQVAMLTRTAKGKEVRLYFIECEKQLKDLKPALSNLSPQLQFLIKLEQEQNEIKATLDFQAEQLKSVEHKLSQTDCSNNYYAITGFANLHGINVDDKTANKAGRKASKLCRERGIKIGDCGSTKFGKIGAYPEEILHEVFDILDI